MTSTSRIEVRQRAGHTWPNFYDPALYEGEVGSGARTDEHYQGCINVQQHRRVLDVGCGTGSLARRLAADGHTVTAIDASSEMVAFARELHGRSDQEAEVVYLTGLFPAVDLPSQSFDAVIMSNELITHFRDRESLKSAFKRARDLLSTSGILLF